METSKYEENVQGKEDEDQRTLWKKEIDTRYCKKISLSYKIDWHSINLKTICMPFRWPIEKVKQIKAERFQEY